MAEVDFVRGQPAAFHAAAVGFGVGFLLAGVLLLLQELSLPNAGWPFVLSLILATVGVLVLMAGVAGIRRQRHPAVDKQIGDRELADRLIVIPERWIPPPDHAGAQPASGLHR